MRLGVWLTLVGLASLAGACSGGYPLPPTRCDEWCDATRGMTCEESYQPASCVSQCEQGNLDVDACRAEFDAEVACFRETPQATDRFCFYDARPNPCGTRIDALTSCVGEQYLKNYYR